jgi:hypothetical protein
MKMFEIKEYFVCFKNVINTRYPEKAFYEISWRLRTGTKGQLLMIDEKKNFFDL